MKLLAILRDSFREAVDHKIFVAMLVLSGLLMLFVASIAYRPITLEEEVKAGADQMTFWAGIGPHAAAGAEFKVENFRQTNDAPEPWRGDYQFDWVVTAKDFGKIPTGLPSSRWFLHAYLADSFHFLKNLDVSSNKSKDPKAARFTVTTKGTTVDDQLGWRYEPKVLFAVPIPLVHTSVREMVYFVEKALVGGFGAWGAVLIGVIITASFIPNMLQKGSIELWLSKPLRRPGLLISKYLGGLTFVFLLTSVTVLGVWTVIGLRSGIWAPGFLVVIPAVTFYFALLYSVSTLTAVLTRSAVVAILVTLAAWFALWLVGTGHAVLDGFRQMPGGGGKSHRPATTSPDDDLPPELKGSETPPNIPNWLYTISDVLYKGLPRTTELNELTAEWVGRGLLSEADQKQKRAVDRPPWYETLGVTAGFIAAMLGLACWKLGRADY